MAEYAGYVASAPVNYGEITNGLVSNIIAIDQAKREEDRKTQVEFDKYFDDNTKAIKDFDFSKSQTFNDMISNVTQGIKDAKLNAYRSGSKQAVNKFSANATTSINNINAASKSINEGFGVIEKATLDGQVSEIGNVYADFYADAMNFKDGAFMVMPDGTIPYVKYDENGKIASANSFLDPATLTKPTAFIDKKVDYEKDLTTWAASLGNYQDENGRIITTSPTLNPAFPKAKETKIEELTSTPRNTARLLSSVAGYRGYKSEASKKELLDSGISEDKLIKVELQNGVPQPVLTDVQRKAAKEIANQQINQRVGVKKSEDEVRSGSNPADLFGAWMAKEEYKSAQDEAKKMKPIISKMKAADKIYVSNKASDWGALKEAARLKGIKNPTVTNTNEGYKILYGIPKGKSNRVEIARFNSGSEIYSYLTGSDNIIQGVGEYNQAKDYMGSAGNSVSSQGKAVLD